MVGLNECVNHMDMVLFDSPLPSSPRYGLGSVLAAASTSIPSVYSHEDTHPPKESRPDVRFCSLLQRSNASFNIGTATEAARRYL